MNQDVKMRVHFASGTHPFDGWTNVDALDFPGVNIKMNLLEPFSDEIANIEIAYIGHFLEHLTHEECVSFLTNVREKMAPGGSLIIIGPDVEKSTVWFNSGRMPKELYDTTQKHGEIPVDEPWNRRDVHVWDCTATAVVGLCKRAGWATATEIPIGEMKGAPMIDASNWQFCVIASV